MKKLAVFSANVITGSGRGRELGFPTMNLSTDAVPEHIENGIYAATITVNDSTYDAAIHYGPRPTFDDSPSLEVHVIDQVLQETPSTIDVSLIEKIRDVKKFNSAKELITQLKKDIDEARHILSQL